MKYMKQNRKKIGSNALSFIIIIIIMCYLVIKGRSINTVSLPTGRGCWSLCYVILAKAQR